MGTHRRNEQHMADGWIKLHRQSIESRVFSDAALWRLWTWCLLRANHSPGYFAGNDIARGSFATGTRAAGETLGLSPSTVHRGLKKLAEWGMIALAVKHGYTVVTVSNYETYQGDGEAPETQVEQRSNGDATPDEREPNGDATAMQPSKKNNNNKKEKKNKKGAPPPAFELAEDVRTESLNAAVFEWLTYKSERGEAYETDTGLRNFLSQVANKVRREGEAATVEKFVRAMASNWVGWDHTAPAAARGSSARPGFNNGPGHVYDPNHETCDAI